MSHISTIHEYYTARGLVYPTAEQALMWAMTELGEAADELLRKTKWIRNNPAKETDYDNDKFVEELGDTMMMLMVAGMVSGKDPLKAMEEKIRRKINETYNDKILP